MTLTFTYLESDLEIKDNSFLLINIYKQNERRVYNYDLILKSEILTVSSDFNEITFVTKSSGKKGVEILDDELRKEIFLKITDSLDDKP